MDRNTATDGRAVRPTVRKRRFEPLVRLRRNAQSQVDHVLVAIIAQALPDLRRLEPREPLTTATPTVAVANPMNRILSIGPFLLTFLLCSLKAAYTPATAVQRIGSLKYALTYALT
jgi:hypothetical protein